MTLPPALNGQKIREVGTRELGRNTSAVIRSVSDGERLVVTRHAEPQAIVFSVRDALELCIEGARGTLATAAERDYRAGRVEDLGPRGPYRVLLARNAISSCARMSARDRRLLRDSLVRRYAEEERLLWLRSGRWLIAFSYVDDATVLVHKAFEVRTLIRPVVGESISRRRQRIELDRGLHGRAPWQLGREPEASG